MDWSNIIKTLEQRGMSLTQIAAIVGASVSGLSDVKTGRTKEPGGSVAVKLYAMYENRVTPNVASGCAPIKTPEAA